MTYFEVKLEPITVKYEEETAFTETYGFVGSQGVVVLEGIYFFPKEKKSETIVLMMHPSSTLQQLPIPMVLAQFGVHVLCCASRYPKNDSALIMEKVLLDLGAYIRFVKEELGYKKVVLLGWSGGGSLALFYQSQAEKPTITHTPANDEVNLLKAKLIPADGLMFIAAHLSRALVLTEWMDPSILDEVNPDIREKTLDIYDQENPNQPPFSYDFLREYRLAQISRNNKITLWVKNKLEELKVRNDGQLEMGFVVHRTMADPRWIDPSVDPNDRKPNWCYLGEPRTVNNGPAGLARFCTLRSWLSQWSLEYSRADGELSAKQISVPFLAIENSADDACPAGHTKRIYVAAGSNDKEMRVVKGAGHYYKNQPKKLEKAVSIISEWMQIRNFR